MSQYYAGPLVKFRLPVAFLCPFDDNGSSDGGSFYYKRLVPRVLTAQVTVYRRMDEARESVIENTVGISVIIYIFANNNLTVPATSYKAGKASEVVSGNRAGAVR